MDPISKDLITFYTYYRSYKYKVLPFKLINGLAIYQRYINDVLFNYLNKFYTVYLDNILIYLDNKLKYKVHIKKVLERLRNVGLQVDIKKCKFRVKRIKYLGFIVSTDRIKVDPKKVEVIYS
jgi:Reverse transcriptase (RNA-dependent DNA polymerase)